MAVKYFFKIVPKKNIAENRGVKYYMFSENGHRLKIGIKKGEAVLLVIRKGESDCNPELCLRLSDIESTTVVDCMEKE